MSTGMQRTTVAVVPGAARDVGRGIARVLGETGTTVYLTDIETRNRKTSSLPGTVEDTADQMTAGGGHGIPVPLGHADDEAMAALFQRLRDEHGGLALLVANACNGNAIPFQSGPFWTLPLEHWHNMVDVGVRSHLVSAWYAAPLLIERHGLVVFTGYTQPDAEVIVAALGEMPPGSDSIEFPGCAVRALLEDPDVARHAGRTIPVADLAKEYGFSDIGVPDEPA
jgi:dehydrogenase/reductase SDR family protein 1